MGYPEKFKPSRINKYDVKRDSHQWLKCYYMAIGLAGGTNDTKVIYFPIIMEAAPLT